MGEAAMDWTCGRVDETSNVHITLVGNPVLLGMPRRMKDIPKEIGYEDETRSGACPMTSLVLTVLNLRVKLSDTHLL
jgi:hypothetical protein